VRDSAAGSGTSIKPEKGSRGSESLRAPARRTRSTRSLLRRRVGASLSVLTCLVLLSGCSTETIDQWKRMGLPESASESAPKMEALWVGAWIAA
jgi:cytochrome c oxidase subunit 2